jgi:hypothetical protein
MNIQTWIKTAIMAVKAGKTSQKEAIPQVLMHLPSPYAEILMTLYQDAANGGKTAEEVLKLFSLTVSNSNPGIRHSEFNSCLQEPDESVMDYHNRLLMISQNMFQELDFAQRESQIFEQFLTGLRPDLASHARLLMPTGVEDLQRAVSYAVTKELEDNRSRNINLVGSGHVQQRDLYRNKYEGKIPAPRNWFPRGTDRPTDGQTDGQTDRQADRLKPYAR